MSDKKLDVPYLTTETSWEISPGAAERVQTVEELLTKTWGDSPRYSTEWTSFEKDLAERLHAALARVADLERAVAAMTLESLTGGERDASEIERLRMELAEAAREIHCAGSVAHRIRVMKREHADEIERLRAGLREIANLDAPHQSAWVAVGLLDTALEIARRLLAREEE